MSRVTVAFESRKIRYRIINFLLTKFARGTKLYIVLSPYCHGTTLALSL